MAMVACAVVNVVSAARRSRVDAFIACNTCIARQQRGFAFFVGDKCQQLIS